MALRVNLVKFLFLQRSKKALHPGVVIASPRAAHALNGAAFSQALSESLTRELASSVAVIDHSASTSCFTGVLKGLDAELFAHVVVHGEADDLSVETIQYHR